MFAYCNNNPVNYRDADGLNAESVTLWTSSMWWLCGVDGVFPFGDIIFTLGIIILCADVVAASKGSNQAKDSPPSLMDYASTTAPPPPPDEGGNGTRVTSKTLYRKGGKYGFRIDVENPGSRPGQIHLQQGGDKYYYNIAERSFRVNSSNGPLAPKRIQVLLKLPEVVKAIEKGLTILGY